MKRILIILFFVSFSFLFASGVFAQERFRLATTTSADNSGLLEVLLPPFEKKFDVKVDVIAVGSGNAFALGRQCDVDVLLVHDPDAEKEFINSGKGINKKSVMVNDFVIVGHESDPAGIKGCKSAGDALRKIAVTKAQFISRGDESGTHVKEKIIWNLSGIEPKGTWYSEVGQGMGAVLVIADERNAYTITDRGTYLAMKDRLSLKVLSEGDEHLINPYSIIAVNPDKCPTVQINRANQLIDWVTSAAGQKIIEDFGKDKFGEPLFKPTAK